MTDIVILIAMILGIPLLYFLILQWYKEDFDQEKNKTRKLLRSWQEIVVMLLAEGALVKTWFDYIHGKESALMFALLYTVLVIMTILCMADYWECIVPNKILLLLILVGLIEFAVQGIRNLQGLLSIIPAVILGFLFCAITFGIAYIVSKGSLGAGDVKLAILLGIFLTGEYVVGTVFYGSLLSAGFSIVQMLRKKLNRKDEIPFVPFLYMGLIIIYLVG
ncbi:MAG: prepilin peptidase [Lachnospiraceae bacterium]|nr:prepilin peptidase [Lachnospiraceae bacterium]